MSLKVSHDVRDEVTARLTSAPSHIRDRASGQDGRSGGTDEEEVLRHEREKVTT